MRSSGNSTSPKHYDGIMVSSTFTDLQAHRKALIRAITVAGMHPISMEYDLARPDTDALDYSLDMVSKAAAYIGLISRKYGHIPDDPDRNPHGYSFTELEFRRAVDLGRPIYLFLMTPEHLQPEDGYEFDLEKREKLSNFREFAKPFQVSSKVPRVYFEFSDLQSFAIKASEACSQLQRVLDTVSEGPLKDVQANAYSATECLAPILQADNPYIGSHELVGRKDELERLDTWVIDENSTLLLDAIGGAGKSLLAWTWLNKHSEKARETWAGRFWYSFYDRGGSTKDFCRRALAYIMGSRPEDFEGKNSSELRSLLVNQLKRKPWLLVLDGLERILASYDRYDAAHMPDEEAEIRRPEANPDPCSAIRSEDEDLLRDLTAVSPSKILMTSRLPPLVLLNGAGKTIPGVSRIRLGGLLPVDAEAMLKACGIVGTGSSIQEYLKENCDCHPLVIGVLAGLIAGFFRDPGNFDSWLGAPDGEGLLDLGSLNLAKRRSHILATALESLPKDSEAVLASLALVGGGVDAEALEFLNAYLPELSESETGRGRATFQGRAGLQRTISNLDQQGLLQFDEASRRHDLHPVVRAVAVSRLKPSEIALYGARVAEYLKIKAGLAEALGETLEEIRLRLGIIRVYCLMGQFSEAWDMYDKRLRGKMVYGREAYSECLAALRAIARGNPEPGSTKPPIRQLTLTMQVSNEIGILLRSRSQCDEALSWLSNAISIAAELNLAGEVHAIASNISLSLVRKNSLASSCRLANLVTALVKATGADETSLFIAKMNHFQLLTLLGHWDQAEDLWKQLESMNQPENSCAYRVGTAEFHHAELQFYRNTLSENSLTVVENLVHLGDGGRRLVRDVYRLRGKWLMKKGLWRAATESHETALQMAKEIGLRDQKVEARLALAKFYLGELNAAEQEAERLSGGKHGDHYAIARLWFELGRLDRAKEHAVRAYLWAWADGEPYIRRSHLDQAKELFVLMGESLPQLNSNNNLSEKKLPWEDLLLDLTVKLEAARIDSRPRQGRFDDIATVSRS